MSATQQATWERALLRSVNNHVLEVASKTYTVARQHAEKVAEEKAGEAAAAVRAELSATLKAELDAATGGSFAGVRDNLLRCLATVTAPDVVLPRMETER